MVGTTRTRFLIVALAVSLFAVGMATFLNYFKFKSTVAATVQSRVLLIGRGIEDSIQASLALGIPLTDMTSVPSLLVREKASDVSILGIDVFDHTGKMIHGTDAQVPGRDIPESWLSSASTTKGPSWRAEQADAYVVGIAIKNSFDLVVGHLALRYARDDVDRPAARVGADLVAKAAIAMLAVALLLPWVLFAVTRRFTTDLQAAEAALEGIHDPQWKAPPGKEGSLAAAVGAAGESLKAADNGLVRLRMALEDKT